MPNSEIGSTGLFQCRISSIDVQSCTIRESLFINQENLPFLVSEGGVLRTTINLTCCGGNLPNAYLMLMPVPCHKRSFVLLHGYTWWFHNVSYWFVSICFVHLQMWGWSNIDSQQFNLCMSHTSGDVYHQQGHYFGWWHFQDLRPALERLKVGVFWPVSWRHLSTTFGCCMFRSWVDANPPSSSKNKGSFLLAVLLLS